jgi:hypothetical protein
MTIGTAEGLMLAAERKACIEMIEILIWRRLGIEHKPHQ